MGVKDSELPIVVGIQAHPKDKSKPPTPFKYKGKLSDKKMVRDLTEFIYDFREGKIKPSLKSQEAPKDNSGPITTLVGNTYKEIVNDEDREVLVNICAPLHDNCLAFQDAFASFGDQVKHLDSLKVATLDIIENEVEGMEVKEVPKLLLYPKGKNKAPKQIPFKGSMGAAEIRKNGLAALKQWMSINSEVYKSEGLKMAKEAGIEDAAKKQTEQGKKKEKAKAKPDASEQKLIDDLIKVTAVEKEKAKVVIEDDMEIIEDL